MPPKVSKARQSEQRAGPRLAPLTTANFQLQVNRLKECANGTPKDPVRYDLAASTNNNDHYVLSLGDEVKLAEAVAFIVAVKKGVEHVSASAIAVPEAAHDGLLFIIASNDGISIRTRDHIGSIVRAIERIATGEVSRAVGRDLLLTLIVEMNSSRINDRLKAKKKDKPIILQGLEQTLSTINQSRLDAEHVAILEDRVRTLQWQIQDYNFTAKSVQAVEQLKNLALACHQFWGAPGSQSTRHMLAQTGVNVHELRGNPCLLHVGKIAAYSYISKELVAYASAGKYRELFQHITVQYVSAYDQIPSAIPQSIKGGCTQCRVHAEVQLVIELDTSLSAKWKRPRTIGSSKAACFLCDLFMHKHGLYFVPRSHGVLTPLWVVPNTETMTKAQKQRYRQVIKAMSVEVLKLTNLKHPRRVDPAMSWQNFSQLGIFRNTPDASRIFAPMSGSQPILVPSILEGVLEERSSALPEVSTMVTGPRPEVPALDIDQMPERHTELLSRIECKVGKAVEAERIVKPDALTVAKIRKLNSSVGILDEPTSSPQREPSLKFDFDKPCQSPRSSSKFIAIANSMSDSLASRNLEKEAATDWLNVAGGQTEARAGREAIDTVSTHDETSARVSTALGAPYTFYNLGRTSNPNVLYSSKPLDQRKPETFANFSDTQSDVRSSDIRGHRSRYSGSAYQGGTPSQYHQVMVAYSDKLSKSIDFHDLEILLEAEEPATMLVDVTYSPKAQMPISTIEVVDLESLKPGEELVVCAETGAEGNGSLSVVMQDKLGGMQQWEMRWKLAVSSNT